MHVPGFTQTAQRAGLPRRVLDVIVVGAGQAGLAVGYHLAQRRLRFVIVDAAPELGHTWRARWDSLRLFTPAPVRRTAGHAVPGRRQRLSRKGARSPTTSKAYAARFSLPVLLDTRVDH